MPPEDKTKYLGIDEVKKIIAEYYDTTKSNVSISFGTDDANEQWMVVSVKPFDIAQLIFEKGEDHGIRLSC